MNATAFMILCFVTDTLFYFSFLIWKTFYPLLKIKWRHWDSFYFVQKVLQFAINKFLSAVMFLE